MKAPESTVEGQTVGSSKLLLYFHANAEDIGLSYQLLDTIRSNMKINVLAPEYPGYGIYRSLRHKNGQKSGEAHCSSQQIKEDAECVYDFIMSTFPNIEEKDLILYGRSMGSGPVVHLASNRSPGAVILMSAYTNVKSVVYEKFGFLSALFNEQFDNLELMSKIKSPTMIIHGKKD